MALKIGRHEHHMLAALVANREKEGIPVSDEEASNLIGYAPATIYNLRQQKGFKDLVLHYAGVKEAPVLPDPIERIRALGLSTLEELQERLINDPDSWTKRELLEMTELLLVKAAAIGPKSGPRPIDGSGVRVAIQFVEARHREIEGHVEASVADLPPTVAEHHPDVVADVPLGAEVVNGAA